MSSLRHHLLLVVVAAVGLTADLASKSLLFEHLGWPSRRVPEARSCPEDVPARSPHYQIIPCVFRLQTSLNSGGIWGAFDGGGNTLAAFSVFAVLLVLYWHMITPPGERVMRVALGLLLAGAMGNFYDRVWIRPDFVEFRYGGREMGRLVDDRDTALQLDTLLPSRGSSVYSATHDRIVTVPLAQLHRLERRTDPSTGADRFHVVLVDGQEFQASGVRPMPGEKLHLDPNWSDPLAHPEDRLSFPLQHRDTPQLDVIRIRRNLGAVRDFIHVYYKDVWDYPIFNIADSCLCVGVAIVLFFSFRDLRREWTAHWSGDRGDRETHARAVSMAGPAAVDGSKGDSASPRVDADSVSEVRSDPKASGQLETDSAPTGELRNKPGLSASRKKKNRDR